MFVRVVLLAAALPALCVGYPTYRELIPNGDRVPNPAVTNAIWKGVGHDDQEGGGKRNPFGRDFAANGYKWDACLCHTDSDGDGRTNGQELGDPDCEWTPGKTPKSNVGLSHPGICEPISNDMCKEKNTMTFVPPKPFECEATKSQDVRTLDVRFPVTEVPATETNYFCFYVDITREMLGADNVHVIAWEPIIDNEEVMHHTVVYGCGQDDDNTTRRDGMTKGTECSSMKCQQAMTIWTIGVNGICYPSTYGYMLGQDGYNGIWLEHHWNNPLKKAGMTDSSGIRFYITDNIRNRTAAMAIWGPLNLGLPVGVRDFEQSGSCPSTCTKDIEEPIYFVELIPHMHYYGRYITAVHVRPGEFERVILDKVPYAYDNPDWIMLDPPLEFRPGDEMRVSCLFTTTSATKPTFFGLGTFDEMCFLLAAYYQVSPSVPVVCGADKAGVGHCGEKSVGFTDECNYSILDRDATMYYDKITAMYGVCDTTGVTCKPLCKDAIEALKASHPCFTGPVGPTLLASFRWFDATIANMLLSCTEAPNQPAGGAGHEHGMEGSTGSGGGLCPVGISPSSATRPTAGLCCTVLLLLKALRGLLQ